MNLHLSYDEKFLDPFIDYAERFTSSDNKYIVICKNGELNHVQSGIVIKSDEDIESLEKIISKLNDIKRIYFHALPKLFAELINGSKITSIKKYLLFYGGEVFGLNRFESEFYLDKTLHINRKLSHSKIELSLNPIQLRRNILNHKHYSSLKFNKDREVESALKKIDFIAHYIQEDVDEYVKKINPNIKQINWNYFGQDQSKVSQIEGKNKNAKTILMGNSASPFNNHIDGIDYLHSLDLKLKIIAPLSYGGNPKYINYVESYGNQKFGDGFQALTKFLKPEKYYSLMRDVKAAVFFNVRSQAAGNILWLLSNKIPVFMLEESSLFKFLKSNDIHVYSIKKHLNLSLGQEDKLKDQAKYNIEAINKVFGEKAMKEKYKSLLE